MDFKKELEQWTSLDSILPTNIPNIELYMDQVTTFLDEQLQNNKRNEDDKIFTKTMINNYSKNDLLPPSNKKKYSKNHMILLIYIYYMKNFLSISDIQALLASLTETFYDDNQEVTFTDIYENLFNLEHDYREHIDASIEDCFNTANKSFDFVEDDNHREQLQKFAFVTLLGYDIYLKKQVIHHMVDHLYDNPDEQKTKKKTKK